jgi:D-3-phosphoglycerate dehydrogenase
MPRLILLDDYRLEAYLDNELLLFSHTDVPGIIGHVGTIFGKHNVNIAQMSVGRATDKPGGHAIGVLNLDAVPPAEAVEALLAIESIERVRLVSLPPVSKLPSWLS